MPLAVLGKSTLKFICNRTNGAQIEDFLQIAVKKLFTRRQISDCLEQQLSRSPSATTYGAHHVAPATAFQASYKIFHL